MFSRGFAQNTGMSENCTSAVFQVLGEELSLGFNEDEEEIGLGLAEVDLENIPSYSQEAAMEILHQGNSEEMTDAECDAFLEDAFVLPEVPDEEEDNMFDIVDVACDAPHKSEEFIDDAIDSIANPKNKKSAKTHERCQRQHANHCKDDLSRKIDSQTTLVNCFSNLAVTG